MNVKKSIKIIFFLGFLIITFSYGSVKKYCGPKEQILGPFRLGETIGEIEKKIGELHSMGDEELYYKDEWHFRFDEDKKILKSISYMKIDIKDNYDYPKTSKGISVGSRLKEVEQVYGVPDQILSIRGYILKNSELGIQYIYLSKGLDILLFNQKPYTGIGDWRVASVEIGDEIGDRLYGAGAYATWAITKDKKRHIIRAYEKKYGKRKDLEIYDSLKLNLEINYFEYIKSKGEYKVVIGMILPRGGDEELRSEVFDENSAMWKNLQSQAKKQTALKYAISIEQLDQIIKRVEEFRTDDEYDGIVEIDYEN